MYIRSVDITNIRCIDHLRFEFEKGKEAGWHVIIGENGSGKTTVARAMAMSLMDSRDFASLSLSESQYRTNESRGNSRIRLHLMLDESRDKLSLDKIDRSVHQEVRYDPEKVVVGVEFSDQEVDLPQFGTMESIVSSLSDEMGGAVRNTVEIGGSSLFGHFAKHGLFSFGIGPNRRFRGNSERLEKLHGSNPRAASHLSLFEDDVAFTQIEPWLKDLRLQEHEGKNQILKNVRNFINDGELLPSGVRLNGISSEGVFFEDSEGKKVNLHDLSDGYRSVLSLTFELIRQLIRCYGPEQVFANIEQGEMTIPLPGVVIIDEIDAHLHPTWQTRIGQWFTRYFPQLQFIVTTHSPLICRGCGANGKIFRLAAPNSDTPSREITGIERDRLVYGDILDAYATDLFGEDIERGEEGRKLQEEYRDLVYKVRYAMPMTAEETNRFDYLNQLFRFNVDHSRSRVK